MRQQPTCAYCGGKYSEHVFMEVYKCGDCGQLSAVRRETEDDEENDEDPEESRAASAAQWRHEWMQRRHK